VEITEHLTAEERRLRWLLWGNAALALIFVAIYIAEGVFDDGDPRFVVNSVAKDGLFAALCLIGAADVRRHGWMALLVAFGYGCLIAAEAIVLVVGGHEPIGSFGMETSAPLFLAAWMAIDIVLAAWLVAWWLAAVRARHGLRYLNPLAFSTLTALADVLVLGPDEALPPEDVARNVDGYLAGLEASGKSRVQLALTALTFWPLLTLQLPLAAMSPARRVAYLERRFLEGVTRRTVLRPLRPSVQAMIRVASQMTYLGYYGDERSWPALGYEPFSKRAGGIEPGTHDRPGPRLRSLSAPPREGHPRYDAIVVGSGAGGAIAASRLARSGRRVLVVERGPHVDPGEFTEDEVQQYLRLYNEGALQLATDFRLQVLQGMCVGGGTTVNNAVCLDPPPPVLDRWAERGIDRAGLERAIREVREWLPIVRMPDKVAGGGGRAFAAGVEALGLPGADGMVDANIDPSCHGCGYCNMGCPFGKKLSMLDTVLPWAQRDHDGKLDVLPGFHVERIVHGRGRAVAVTGTCAGEELTIPADDIVVAAGAVASSWLLQRSDIGGERPGAELYFNINSPLTAEFAEPVDAFAGLQMSHAYVPGSDGDAPGFVLETWFNPPATQSLAMPGWFGRHYENMRRYRYMACGGALVGTTSPATLRATRKGPDIRYAPSGADLARVVEGLKLMGRIFFAAGATRVLPATFAWSEYRSPAALDRLGDAVRDNTDLLLTTAHPQGGNPVGEVGQGGVVDDDFRVHGFENLYVCDASVFPSSVTVNPQLTVMGLALYAGDRIAAAA
jgi:choline dehydrogenase-like flavoprotein